MSDDKKAIRIKNMPDPGAAIWFIGWLFSLGLLKFTFWKALLALIIWPYYIGDFVSNIIK